MFRSSSSKIGSGNLGSCSSLKSPAIFSSWEDCRFFIDQQNANENNNSNNNSNDGSTAVEYKEFESVDHAVAFAFYRFEQSPAPKKLSTTAVVCQGGANG